MDPGTLPQLTKMELFATIGNGFQLLTIVEETSVCTVVSLFCSLSKVTGWFQSSNVVLDACFINLRTKYWETNETSLMETVFSKLT